MKALSVRQPWAWLICMGYKDIENRGKRVKNLRRVYVHASKSRACMDEATIAWVSERLQENEKKLFAKALENLPFGAVIGEVDITACVDRTESPWFTGPLGYVLSNAVLYDKPKPCRGSLGFFTPGFQEVGETGVSTQKGRNA